VAISLTALTGGIAPAFADPRTDPVTPTTIVAVPEPEAKAPEQAPEPKAPQQAPAVVEQPVAPVIPQAPPSVEAPPPPRVTEAPAVVQAPPQTQAPVTQSSTAKPSTVAPTTAASAPATSAEPPSPRIARPSVAEQAPATSAEKTAAPVPASAPVTTSASPSPSAGSTPPSPGLLAPSTETGQGPAPTSSGEPSAETSASPTSEAGSSSAEPTSGAARTASSSVSQAAKEIETLEPQTLKAPEQDVVLAKSTKPVEQLDPVPAPKQDVEAIAKAIDVPNFDRDIRDGRDGRDGNFSRKDGDFFPGGDRKWDRNVRQWDPNWVEYDDYYRPVISNPYRNPVKIIYIYQNAPRIAYIPPLARIILEVAQFAAYSFTAIVTNTINQAVNVAVGSFFGGGYFPGIGLPLPPPPPPLFRYDNVPVQVRYSNEVYQPFRVQRIVDVGNDTRYGERKVLLDGVTPAWGEWTQTATGERQFEVHKTQQFPGLDEPREGPLPGDYQLRLASDESSTGLDRRDVYLLSTAVLLGVLSLGAVGWAVLLGRRRIQH
jgi:hypothetical protein